MSGVCRGCVGGVSGACRACRGGCRGRVGGVSGGVSGACRGKRFPFLRFNVHIFLFAQGFPFKVSPFAKFQPETAKNAQK